MSNYSGDTNEWIRNCDNNIRPYAKIGWIRGVLVMSAIKNHDGHINEFVADKGSVCWLCVTDDEVIKTLPLEVRIHKEPPVVEWGGADSDRNGCSV